MAGISDFETVGAGLLGSLGGAVLVYLATRQKISTEAGVAREKLEGEADIAREKLLADATKALYEQQGRYIDELQKQATVVSTRLEGVDLKLREAQAAVLAAYQENVELTHRYGRDKAELTLQLDRRSAELADARDKLVLTQVKLADALAANQVLLDQLAHR